MKQFEIVFYPAIDLPLLSYKEGFIDKLDFGEILTKVPEQYDIRYLINGKMFCYYPASVLTILNDIHLEWTLMCQRVAHSMTLSGYTILMADFVNDDVRISDPVVYDDELKRDPLISIINAQMVEDAFRRALDSIYSLIIHKLGGNS